MISLAQIVILKLLERAMGCKVEWTEEELKLMEEYIEGEVIE